MEYGHAFGNSDPDQTGVLPMCFLEGPQSKRYAYIYIYTVMYMYIYIYIYVCSCLFVVTVHVFMYRDIYK